MTFTKLVREFNYTFNFGFEKIDQQEQEHHYM